MKKLLTTLCTSLLAGCANHVCDAPTSPEREPFVVNGYEASYQDFPSIGAMVSPGGTQAHCTVSFVKNDLALTAAHCLEVGLVSFILYGYDEEFEEPCDESLYTIVASKMHPDYKESKYSNNWRDLALLLLEEEVPDVEPISILQPSEFETALRLGNMVTIAGYGAYGEYDYVSGSGKLYAADVPITGHLNEYEIMLAGEELTQGDACYGDSGGPAYVYAHGKVQLTGVASRAPPGSFYKCGEGTIYTLPGRYAEWIENTYQELREEYPLKKPMPIDQDTEAVAVNENWLYPSGGASCQFSPSSSNGSSLLGLLLGLYALRRKRK